VEVVVILLPGIEEDAAKLLEIVDAVPPIDHGVEAEPAIPDVFDSIAEAVAAG
jgi:hypothetical protein